MKRLLALVLALVLALGVLSGCQKEAAPTGSFSTSPRQRCWR